MKSVVDRKQMVYAANLKKEINKNRDINLEHCNIQLHIESLLIQWYNTHEALYVENGGHNMTFNYNKLWKILIDRNMMKTDLVRAAHISTNAMAKMGKNEDVRLEVLAKVCSALDCKLDDIVDFIPEETDKVRKIGQ